MEALQITLFILALSALLTQTVRHLYVRWLEPTSSALDKYEPQVKVGIKKAGSLEEMVKHYDEARKKTLGSEFESSKVNSKTVFNQNSETESMLKTAIQEWERRTKEIFELRFYWVCGLVLLILGLLCYQQQFLWAGLTLMATGISEMIWWTSPSFRWGGGSEEFDKLLTNKIAFSLASVILLLITGYIVNRLNSLGVML
jgi:hypothetical protein